MMTTPAKINIHKHCILILEKMQELETLIRHREDDINGFAGTFRELRIEYIEKIDDYNKAIEKLEQRLDKQMEKLNNL